MKQTNQDFATQLQQFADRFSQLAADTLHDYSFVSVAKTESNRAVRIPEESTCDPETSAALTTDHWKLTTWRSPISLASVENENLQNGRQLSQLTTHNSQLPNCASNLALDSFLLNHYHLEGARALRFLIQHPDEEFTPLTLIQILSGTISYERYIPYDLMQQTPEERDTLQETSIPMTDEATLDAVRKRMEEINAQREKLRYRQPDCAPLDTELSQLRQYLLQCSRANGQLRSFNGVSRRPYQALCASINRTRKLLKKQAPELDSYVAQHLQINPYFCWNSKKQL